MPPRPPHASPYLSECLSLDFALFDRLFTLVVLGAARCIKLPLLDVCFLSSGTLAFCCQASFDEVFTRLSVGEDGGLSFPWTLVSA